MSELSMPLSWNRDSKPHRFCPGCGHGLVLKSLGYALDEMGIIDRTIFACDIGCSLLAWNFFNCDSLQTHHGRTIPVCVGLKRARPDLYAIAYMGDGGGYAIGLQHLVSAALRDEPVTVILANNTLYAMTGGQLAPTTLTGQKTATSPYGREPENTGPPFKGPETLSRMCSAGAYLARGTVAKPQRLKNAISRGLQAQQDGHFAFIEALSTCPTNWRTNASKTWAFLEKDMGDVYPVGEIETNKRGSEER